MAVSSLRREVVTAAAVLCASCISPPPATGGGDLGGETADATGDTGTIAPDIVAPTDDASEAADGTTDVDDSSDQGDTSTVDSGPPDRPEPVEACGEPTVPVPMGRWDMDAEVGGAVPNTGWGGSLDLDLDGAELGSGKIGQAIVLDGSGETLPQIPDHPMFRRLDQGTVTVRVAVASAAVEDDGNGGIFSKDALGRQSSHLSIDEDAGGLALRIQRGGTEDQIDVTSDPIEGDRWYHLAVTWTDGGSAFWVDGSASRVAMGWSIADNEEPIGIGFSTEISDDGSALEADAFLNGSIDEVAVWDEVLTDDVIVALAGESCSVPVRE